MAKRVCNRCHVEQAESNFKPTGQVCFTCKIKSSEAAQEKQRTRIKVSKAPRECKRCGKVKPVEEFTATGKICLPCKWAAVESLPARRAEQIRNATSRRKAKRKRARQKAEWARDKRRKLKETTLPQIN